MASELLVRNTRIDGGDGSPVDLLVRGGDIAAILPAGAAAAPAGAEIIDAGGGLLSSPFAEPHSHPDKVYSRERIADLGPRVMRDREDRMQRQRDLKARFTHADVEERSERFLRDCALEGIGVVSGQADIDSITGLISVEGLLATRDRSRGWIDLVVTAFPLSLIHI